MRVRNAVSWVLVINVMALLLLSHPSAGFEWENFTEEDGLIHFRAHSVYESADGSIWMGMDCSAHSCCGLNQYIDGELLTWDEGVRFCPYAVYGICEDSQGTIWSSCNMLGCGFLQDGLWQKGFEVGFTVSGIDCGPDGRLWVGSVFEGIVSYNPVTGEKRQVLAPPWAGNPLLAVPPEHLFVSSDGHIWFSLDRAEPCLYEINDTGEVLRTFPGRKGTVAESPDGTIWFGQTRWFGEFEEFGYPSLPIHSVERLEGDEFVYAGPPEGYPVLAHGPISISSSGELVCAADLKPFRAIVTFDGQNWSYYKFPFDAALIWIPDLLIDSRDDIWVATRPTGPLSPIEGFYVLHRDGAPDIWVSVAVKEQRYSAGDSIAGLIDLGSTGHGQAIDLYLALEPPWGSLLFYPSFGTSMTPSLLSVDIPADTYLHYEPFSLTLPDLPAGTYRWHAALTHAGTTDFASNIASCEWQFTK